jgi:hypothetical protein
MQLFWKLGDTYYVALIRKKGIAITNNDFFYSKIPQGAEPTRLPSNLQTKVDRLLDIARHRNVNTERDIRDLVTFIKRQMNIGPEIEILRLRL